MAGDVPTMEVNETTVDREETVFTAKHLNKIEAYLASKYIKLDKVHRAGIFFIFYEGIKLLVSTTTIQHIYLWLDSTTIYQDGSNIGN
ncbi:hypothetical protein PVK06_035483 [Gossypium arboreum]|uniref:Uncharacterized protein n=1 Tax=Gossypium arboreum TaxID=29729 RepID=A0ABR0NGY0_GOSAR|nr:hypothetical protein PVK06_035483 [Gossypium arboreum]